MSVVQWGTWVLVAGAAVVVLSTYPYVATAISYRGSDNGLAYILLVMGAGVWNAMFAAQVLDPDPLVKGFFLALSFVGSSLAGLGWFLFAATASSTVGVPQRRLVYGITAVLTGLNIVCIATTPAHDLYWSLSSEPTGTVAFVAISPQLGYWIHTTLLVVLFAAGTSLFADAWDAGISVRYTRAYTCAGIVTVLAVLTTDVLVPGGASATPLVAAGLTTVGWLQADDGRFRLWLRTMRPS
ncbi:histidine kinase N-terminal 7TM domain-containing protein [Natrialbaceae archaeon AArc-T1-2]|uniref:histidine kinase N-terminal 7TM domain-containing protein n=1 Tax=Natrialbaceae archaeon AArc-T1-2 TaxID=3053904 RepID=UPI00255A891E|nr:histidine kinase N-terminal 7TM domain-containing protein [Natrialbaceae archaeon AArc-T1-2]WIV66435.1 histidine kinase N-terminal 7TM domain-containing protein [Natrialbaceae archaeon AArc-T1-2]